MGIAFLRVLISYVSVQIVEMEYREVRVAGRGVQQFSGHRRVARGLADSVQLLETPERIRCQRLQAEALSLHRRRGRFRLRRGISASTGEKNLTEYRADHQGKIKTLHVRSFESAMVIALL
jgi:hypothetical protein